MAVHSGSFFTALLVLVVSGAEGQTCTNYIGLADCSAVFGQTVANMSGMDLANLNKFCGIIEVYKSCLAGACGGWDNVPQAILDSIDNTLQQYGLNCDNLDDECQDYAAAIGCGSQFNDRVFDAGLGSVSIHDYCELVNDYKSCLVDACGHWDKVPSSIGANIDNSLEANNLHCAETGLSSSLLLTIGLSAAVHLFLA